MEAIIIGLIETAPVSISVIALFYLLFRRLLNSTDNQSKGIQAQTAALIEIVSQGQKIAQNNTKAVEALTEQLAQQNAEMVATRTIIVAEIRQTKEQAVEEIVERIVEIIEGKNDVPFDESSGRPKLSGL